MGIVVIESSIICLFMSVIVVIGTKKNPLSGLHNLPLSIQQRVFSLPQYQNIKILSTKQRIMKKIPALVIVFLLFLGLVFLAGAQTFQEGFLYSFVLWSIVKIYVVLVLNCLWYAHAKQYWIQGTEDLKSEYQNYAFYLKSLPRSLLAGLIVALCIGLCVMIFN